MSRWIASVCLVLACVIECGGAETPRPKIALSGCTLKGVDRPARCGVFDVAEDRSHPDGRPLSLRVIVLPARSGSALPDPIVVLGGGPGEAATDAVEDADEFAGLDRDRDILYVDQRGTGPDGLQCDLYDAADPAASLRELFPLSSLTACAKRLAAKADLTQYSYSQFADDLDDVRRALGYGPMNLFAISYGTRAAQVYVRKYPKSVRTIYMGSIVPIDIAIPAPFARAEQEALDKTLTDCAADASCNSAYPQLRDEFTHVLATLDAGNARVDFPGAETVVMPRGRFIEYLRSLLYKPESAAAIPAIIHEAALGHWTAIGKRIADRARSAGQGGFGLFFTITCNEDVAFLDEKKIREQTRNTYLGDFRVRRQMAVCAHWPRYTLPISYRKPIRSAVPTLFVSGDLDPATPLWFTEHAAPGFPQRFEIILHGQAHGGWNDCVQGVYTQFVKDGSTRGLSDTCAAPTRRPPFKVGESVGR
jgi:pimeloyl-ACP methyl ester carboxylesterase